jgi:3'-phosphoadenosine 5'-phosphosulfate sulfotransferase
MNNLDTYIAAPIYYRVVRRSGTKWHFVIGESFYNPLNLPSLSLDDLFATYGTSMREAARELLKVNNGAEGLYLVDIMDKRYYYCGSTTKDVRNKLIELGIGRSEPIAG